MGPTSEYGGTSDSLKIEALAQEALDYAAVAGSFDYEALYEDPRLETISADVIGRSAEPAVVRPTFTAEQIKTYCDYQKQMGQLLADDRCRVVKAGRQAFLDNQHQLTQDDFGLAA